MSELSTIKFRAILIVWTLGIWGSRLRNIQSDDDLTGVDRIVAIGVAYAFLATATATGAAILRRSPWETYSLMALVAIGIVRWTLRGPIIVFSGEWDVGFKVVHTVLWLVTIALSVLAWREHREARTAKSS